MTTDLSLRLAEATVPCPGEYHHMPSEHKQGDKPCCLAYSTRAPLPECDAAGRVPWLTGVRVTCPGDVSLSPWTVVTSQSHGNFMNNKYIRSCNCQSRGWTVSEDRQVWLEAARPIAVQHVWSFGPTDTGWEIWNPMGTIAAEISFQATLLRALEQVKT